MSSGPERAAIWSRIGWIGLRPAALTAASSMPVAQTLPMRAAGAVGAGAAGKVPASLGRDFSGASGKNSEVAQGGGSAGTGLAGRQLAVAGAVRLAQAGNGGSKSGAEKDDTGVLSWLR